MYVPLVMKFDTYISNELKPNSFDIWDICLTSKLPLTTHLQRHSCHLGCQCTESHHHSVDSVLQVQNLASSINFNLLGEIAQGDCFGDLCDRTDLASEIGGKVVDHACEFSPGSFDVKHECLPTEFAGR